MKLLRTFVIVMWMCLFAPMALMGCHPPAKIYQSKLDPLALQQMQTQEFETSKKILLAATISVFQDTGFTIDTGDYETGLITAKSPTSFNKESRYSEQGLGFSMSERATAFVEETRLNYAKVRLNYIQTSRFNTGLGEGAPMDSPNEDPAYYEKVFNKIREAVFLREAYKATPASK